MYFKLDHCIIRLALLIHFHMSSLNTAKTFLLFIHLYHQNAKILSSSLNYMVTILYSMRSTLFIKVTRISFFPKKTEIFRKHNIYIYVLYHILYLYIYNTIVHCISKNIFFMKCIIYVKRFQNSKFSFFK